MQSLTGEITSYKSARNALLATVLSNQIMAKVYTVISSLGQIYSFQTAKFTKYMKHFYSPVFSHTSQLSKSTIGLFISSYPILHN